jgi:flagellar biosynthesis protein FlhB
MPERRPFPPSPRRRALAHKAGLSAASPLLVGAAATGAAAAASVMLARAAATTLGRWIAAACDGRATLTPEGAPRAVLALALPLLGILAVIAIASHLAQTRALWLPRRRIDGAPALPARRGVIDMLGAIAIGVTTFGWLWLTAPRLARATSLDDAGAALAAFLATLAIAWVALGALDALLRHAALGNALSMTAAEKREDDRLAAADPRWRQRRAQIARESPRQAVAGSTLLLLGDDVAVAIAWDPVRRPVPLRTATGRGPAATQLLGLARRHAIPVHRDAPLARLLAGEGPVPEAHWPRIAEIVAAVSSR